MFSAVRAQLPHGAAPALLELIVDRSKTLPIACIGAARRAHGAATIATLDPTAARRRSRTRSISTRRDTRGAQHAALHSGKTGTRALDAANAGPAARLRRVRGQRGRRRARAGQPDPARRPAARRRAGRLPADFVRSGSGDSRAPAEVQMATGARTPAGRRRGHAVHVPAPQRRRPRAPRHGGRHGPVSPASPYTIPRGRATGRAPSSSAAPRSREQSVMSSSAFAIQLPRAPHAARRVACASCSPSGPPWTRDRRRRCRARRRSRPGASRA